jgi:predicted glycogen debranching enzyme
MAQSKYFARWQIEVAMNPNLSSEWLETNGIGGFSSSTISGINTRRYHGLLTAATKPPVGRLILLSKLEETLIIDGSRHEFSANQYRGVIHPQGFNYQISFRLDPFPIFTYEIDAVRIEKSVFMVHGENTTVVQYKLMTNRKHLKLEIRPLLAFRDYHSTTHENDTLNPDFETEPGHTTFRPYHDLPVLHLAHDPAEIDAKGFWYRNFQYAIEQERGLDFAEDLFSPCAFSFDLNARDNVSIIASTERRDVDTANTYREFEITRRLSLNHSGNRLTTLLTKAADQFLVARQHGETVIAGYHWFADWGRDTMISLPGLTLVTGRWDAAKSRSRDVTKPLSRRR